ncbi:LamG-like jellyroll fold domain-containing protein [Adhaeribacter soli]|nr:LamG-like jellyroll fold domain-containing protein [Adhaeribacter soli]
MQPSISLFAPASAQVTGSVVISGSDFTSATAVSFNGTPALSFTVNSSTQITAIVPYCATTGAISVVTPSGTAISSGSFTVLPDVTMSVGKTQICNGDGVLITATSSLNTSGTALNFDGAGQYVNVPSFNLNNDGRAITVEFWVNIPSTVTGNRTVFAATNTNSKIFHAMIPANNRKDLAWNYGNVLAAGRLSTDFTPYFNKWTHVALVSAGRLGSFKAIYINGVEVARDNGLSEGAITNGTTMLKIGDDVSSTIRTYFRGSLDEFRIWDKVRSPQEIQRDMHAIVPASTPNLITYWRFDEGSGTKISHISGTNLDGTLTAGSATGVPVWQASGAGLQPHISWSPAASLSSASGATVTASPSATTTYTATATYPNGCTRSIAQTISVSQTGTFTGTASSDWNDVANWCGGLPTAATDVIIPANAVNMPQVSTIANCRNLTIENGATLSLINGADLKVNGTFTPSGTFTHTDGTIAFTAAFGTQYIPSLIYHNLVISGKNAIKELQGDIEVTGNLVLTGSPLAFTFNLSRYNVLLRGDLTLGGSQSGTGFIILQNSAIRSINIFNNNLEHSINFEIDNPAGVQLNSDLILNGNLVFKSGIMSGNSIILNGNLTGEDITTHFKGKITKTLAISGPGTYSFDDMGLLFDNVGSGNWGKVTVSRYNGVPVQNPRDKNKESISRQWLISPEIPANTAVDLTFTWLSSDDNGKDFSTGEGQVWKSNDAGANWIPIEELKAITSNGNMRSIKVSTKSFSSWTISDINSPLPVTWLSFSGKNTHAGVLLEWQTATEENSSNFIVERATDGKEFKPVGEVASAGNSHHIRSYQFTDETAAKIPILYYRLKQHDYDGTYNYSKIITVPAPFRVVDFVQAYPNPCSRELHLRFQNPVAGAVKVELLDLNNQVRSSFLIKPDKKDQVLELPHLPQGIYLLRTTYSDQILVMKIIKQ